ncbi:MAG TPA: RDD family protein [Planctomycetaceae bacterium]|nr:RDD family protein [Planctomycetaceae bacterium]
MTTEPATLDESDFDAPEGYRSAETKTTFLVIVSVASAVFFFAQFILPQVVSFYFMPGMMSMGGGGVFQMEIPEVHKAAVWNEQAWMPVTRIAAGPKPLTFLRAATLTGEWVKDSDLQIGFTPDFLFAEGDRLWCVAPGHVAIVEGRNSSTSYPTLKLNAPSNPYLQDGKLRIVDRDAAGTWRILEFGEGEWTVVGRMPLPASTTPLPLNAATVTAGVMRAAQTLRVVPHEGRIQAIFSDGSTHWFAESLPEEPLVNGTTDEAVSALTALQPETSPWVPCNLLIGTIPLRLDGRLAVVDSSGPPPNEKLTASWLVDGQRQPFGTLPNTLVEHHNMVADAAGRAYVLTDSFPPGNVRVTKLTPQGFETSETEQKQSLFSGPLGEFMRNYLMMIVVSTGIVALLQLLYVGLLQVAMRRCRTTQYGFAHRTVRLASIGRRALARTIDNVLCWLPILAIWAWLFYTPEVLNLERLMQQFNSNPFEVFKTVALLFLGMMTYGVSTIIVFGALEGIYGWSPGKYLCRLRVIRTTLEPIGVLRGLIRQFLLMIDGQFTYLVGCAMVAVLAKRQRLGDLAADSIVVDAASLTSDDSSHLVPRDKLLP